MELHGCTSEKTPAGRIDFNHPPLLVRQVDIDLASELGETHVDRALGAVEGTRFEEGQRLGHSLGRRRLHHDRVICTDKPALETLRPNRPGLRMTAQPYGRVGASGRRVE